STLVLRQGERDVTVTLNRLDEERVLTVLDPADGILVAGRPAILGYSHADRFEGDVSVYFSDRVRTVRLPPSQVEVAGTLLSVTVPTELDSGDVWVEAGPGNDILTCEGAA